jgi:hypothetical protein
MPGGACRELGFTSITDNIKTSPKTQLPKVSNPKVAPSPLVNMVDSSADTSVMEVPMGGTIESGGING